MPLLPSTGKKPRVILGLMTYGPDPNEGGKITTIPDFKSHLDVLQAAGYNELDTARVYIDGAQEAFTRSADYHARGFSLATKVYPTTPGIHKPDVLRAQFETSLSELGTQCVEIFYLHAADRSVPFEDTLREVDRFHKEGKFIQLGLSNFTAFEVAECVMTCKANGWVRPTIYQGMYNAVTRSIERELIPACRRYGLDIVIYNPLAGGLFSGKYSAASMEVAPGEGRFSDTSTLGSDYRKRYFKDATFAALAVVEPVVEKFGLTLVETALRWVVHHSALKIMVDGNDGVIIGVSSLKQLEGNLEILQRGPLPKEVCEALDKAWKIAEPDTPNYWHLDLEYTYDTKRALFGLK